MWLLGGRWDDSGGRPSGFFERFVTFIMGINPQIDCFYLNGGAFKDLDPILRYGEVPRFTKPPDYVIWMVDCPNDKPKLVSEIKNLYPKCVLVTSKRNDNAKYSFMDLMFHALHLKSNLLMEFSKGADGMVSASVYDPLGNAYGCIGITDPAMLASVVVKRMLFLGTMTRQKSIQDGPALEVPEKSAFFNLVRDYADTYHNLIHAKECTRMLGNVSFRCEKGFPSFRDGEVVYVSRRNMDKRMIGKEGFVAVDLDDEKVVRYCGEFKPSVDTPIQTALYRKYPAINYMLHSHVYVEGAPMTEAVIPCGAMEEYNEIVERIGEPSHGVAGIRLNLRGHGSLVMGANLEAFINIPYVARVFPEVQG